MKHKTSLAAAIVMITIRKILGSEAHPASCTMSTGSLFSEVKRQGRGVNHPPPSSAEVKE